jgi:hypothetical protein
MTFLESVFGIASALQNKMQGANYKHNFMLLLMHKGVVNLLAKYVHDVLTILGSKDIYIVHPSMYKNCPVQELVCPRASMDTML